MKEGYGIVAVVLGSILALAGTQVGVTGFSMWEGGEVYGGAKVSLRKQDGRIIEQGLTDRNGRLDIYGAAEGDTIQAISPDGGLRGSVTVGTATSLTLVLESRHRIYLPVTVK